MNLFSGAGVPIAFMITKSHESSTYCRLLRKLFEASDKKWQPKAVMCDFELAIALAAKEVFPSIQILGCRFHFMQAVRKQCKGKSLLIVQPDAAAATYDEIHTKQVEALVRHLQQQETKEQFDKVWGDILPILKENFANFYNYFLINWIGSNDPPIEPRLV